MTNRSDFQKDRRRFLQGVVGTGFVAGLGLNVAGCRDSDAGVDLSSSTAGASSGPPNTGAHPGSPVDTQQQVDAARLPSVGAVRAGQTEIDGFNRGFRPTGSPANENYIQHLKQRLGQLGVSDVQSENYSFTMWTPGRVALALTSGNRAGPVAVASYVPYSGKTPAKGITAPLVYLPGLAAANISTDLVNGASPTAALSRFVAGLKTGAAKLAGDVEVGATTLAGAIAAAEVRGKIVSVDVPKLAIPFAALTAPAYFVNDPDRTFKPDAPYTRPFVALVYVPVILDALKAAGARAVVAILDYPPEAANHSYFPFFGTTEPNIPAIYVDRGTGNTLKQTLAAQDGPVNANLILEAQYTEKTSENLVGFIPGTSDEEIIVSSHTDGSNSVEDNGPAAILHLAKYFLSLPRDQRKRGLRIVFTGGHFVGSKGIAAYLQDHAADTLRNALAAIEIEHLGALEWLEQPPGSGNLALTGLNEPQIIFTSPNQPLVDASKRFASNFERFIVLPPDLPFGEGQAYRTEVPLIQFITGPVYLLNYYLPAVTNAFTDYDLEQRQIAGFAQMIVDLFNAPADQLGQVPGTAPG